MVARRSHTHVMNSADTQTLLAKARLHSHDSKSAHTSSVKPSKLLAEIRLRSACRRLINWRAPARCYRVLTGYRCEEIKVSGERVNERRNAAEQKRVSVT